MRKLLNGVLALAMLMMVGQATVKAQDVTDEDLKHYAIIELAKSMITDGISPMVNDLIEKQEGMTGQRFQELQAHKDNLDAVKAEDWEKKFLEVVNKQIDKKKKAATDVVKLLASRGMGAAKYKATKAAIASNPEMKKKFEEYVAALK